MSAAAKAMYASQPSTLESTRAATKRSKRSIKPQKYLRMEQQDCHGARQKGRLASTRTKFALCMTTSGVNTLKKIDIHWSTFSFNHLDCLTFSGKVGTPVRHLRYGKFEKRPFRNTTCLSPADLTCRTIKALIQMVIQVDKSPHRQKIRIQNRPRPLNHLVSALAFVRDEIKSRASTQNST